ncbi:murein L,D-transpeptidase catalytic domain family protein [uncultured Mucilaginibacter sp.]|uniref:murein L,D-transpeptidase catalytic domain family protein n=1 Tax=uncultured Mucilaginibacter sp. TaxID=797541 RepID=UPI0026340D38|nr:murein L,D-transpeptidase catalytic domain family protein [uncultured Mucilaginibacter sp.]
MNKNFFKKSILLSLALSVTIISTTLKTFTRSSQTNFARAKQKSTLSPQELLYSTYLSKIYQTANLYAAGLNEDVFAKAVTGFYNLKNTTNLNDHNSIITIVDFTKSSCAKRMWIIDLQSGSLLLNTWVAHGQGSGDDMPNQFSNIDSSHQSSLGFYLTGEIYTGKHGRSLRLDGLDANFNTNARQRDIVIHGADYVSEQTIKNLGRLGRSFGCPAVAPELTQTIINLIKDKTVLYINGSDNRYSSKYLDQDLAANYLFPEAATHGPLQAML